MEVGSRSEGRALEAVSGIHEAPSNKRLIFLAQRGLVGSYAESYCSLATPPDGVARFDDDGLFEARALEVRTFSGAESVAQAADIRQKYGEIVKIDLSFANLDAQERATELIKAVIPQQQHRRQIIHHASANDHEKVSFIAASRTKILYVVEAAAP